MEQAKLIAAKLEQANKNTAASVAYGYVQGSHGANKLWTSSETDNLLKELAKHKHVLPSFKPQLDADSTHRRTSQDSNVPASTAAVQHKATASSKNSAEHEFIAAFAPTSVLQSSSHSSTASTIQLPLTQSQKAQGGSNASNQQRPACPAISQPTDPPSTTCQATATPQPSARSSMSHRTPPTTADAQQTPTAVLHQPVGQYNIMITTHTSSIEHGAAEALLGTPPIRPPDPNGASQPSSISAAEVTHAALLSELEASRKREACLAQQLSRAFADTQDTKQQLEHQKQLSKELAAAGRAAREALGKMADQNARLVSAYVATKQQLQTLQVQHQQLQQASRQSAPPPRLHVETINLAMVNNSSDPSPCSFASDTSPSNPHPASSSTRLPAQSAASSAPSSSSASPRPAPNNIHSNKKPTSSGTIATGAAPAAAASGPTAAVDPGGAAWGAHNAGHCQDPASSATAQPPPSNSTATNPTTADPEQQKLPSSTQAASSDSTDSQDVPFGGESPQRRAQPPVRTASFLRRSTDPERYTCPSGNNGHSLSRSTSDDGGHQSPPLSVSCTSDSEAPGSLSGQCSPRSQALEEAQRQARELQEQNQQLLQAHQEAARLRQQMEQMQEAERLKQEGNKAYQRQQHTEAVTCYSKALALPSPTPSFRATLHCNRAAALHGMGSYTDAIADCFHALTLDPSYLRPLQRRADAYCALGDYANAAADLRKACEDKHASKELLHRLWDVQHRAKSSMLINHYAVLGISSASSTVDIKAAYKRLALKYHPDKASTASEQSAAAVLFRMISSAHTVLTNPEKRKAFDAARLRRKLRRSFSMYHF